MKNDRYNWYLKRVETIRQWAERLSQDQDKMILAISSGALLLSVNFVDKLVTPSNIQSVKLLLWSWGLLTFSIISNLLSFSLAISITKDDKNELDEWLNSGKRESPDHNKGFKDRLLFLINFLTKFSLIVGIILLFYFVFQGVNTLAEI